jgi:hypothetical protein
LISYVEQGLKVKTFRKLLNFELSKNFIFLIFVRFFEIEESMEDPKSGESLHKSVFMIFFQVNNL